MSNIRKSSIMESLEQFREYYCNVLKEISSESYFGRSAYGNGDIKAAKYIIDRLVENGAEPLRNEMADRDGRPAYPEYKSAVIPGGEGRWNGEPAYYKDFLQHFEYPMNVMRGSMELSVDGKEYRPTFDFVVKEFSPSCKGEFRIHYLDERYYSPDIFCNYLSSGEFRNSFVVLDWKLFWEKLPSESWLERYFPYLEPLENIGGIILKDSKPEQFPYFKARSYKVLNMPVLVVNSTFPDNAVSLCINIESQMIEHKDGHNILAVIKGSVNPEKYTFFVAHYDHLGLMGAGNVYPGANDNGSGTAMLLALSHYYSKHKPANSVVFFFPDAEESNLLGSFYYVENPYVPLDKTVNVIDVDMVADTGNRLSCQVGDGKDSTRNVLEEFKVCNSGISSPFEEILREELNDNSDHYPFVLKGVPAIYLEIVGDCYRHYHTPRDSYGNSSDSNIERLLELVVSFAG